MDPDILSTRGPFENYRKRCSWDLLLSSSAGLHPRSLRTKTPRKEGGFSCTPGEEGPDLRRTRCSATDMIDHSAKSLVLRTSARNGLLTRESDPGNLFVRRPDDVGLAVKREGGWLVFRSDALRAEGAFHADLRQKRSALHDYVVWDLLRTSEGGERWVPGLLPQQP